MKPKALCFGLLLFVTLPISGASATVWQLDVDFLPDSSLSFSVMFDDINNDNLLSVDEQILVSFPSNPSIIYVPNVPAVPSVATFSVNIGLDPSFGCVYGSANWCVTSAAGFAITIGADAADLSLFHYDLTQVSSAPLPASLPLLASGFSMMGLLGWRRRKRVKIAAIAAAQCRNWRSHQL